MSEAQENFWFYFDFPLFSSIFHFLCKVCEKNSRIFAKTKRFCEKTQRTGSRSLHLAPKKVVNKKACSIRKVFIYLILEAKLHQRALQTAWQRHNNSSSKHKQELFISKNCIFYCPAIETFFLKRDVHYLVPISQFEIFISCLCKMEGKNLKLTMNNNRVDISSKAKHYMRFYQMHN